MLCENNGAFSLTPLDIDSTSVESCVETFTIASASRRGMFGIDLQTVLYEVFEVVFIVGETIIMFVRVNGEVSAKEVFIRISSLEHNFWVLFAFLDVLIE